MIKAIYNGKKSIELVNAPVPKANDNDIVIKNIYSNFSFKHMRNRHCSI